MKISFFCFCLLSAFQCSNLDAQKNITVKHIKSGKNFLHHTWYVSGKGNDDNAGRSLKSAFLTLKKAASVVQPGDTVYIGNGIYTNEEKTDGSSILTLTTSGTADAWITWKTLSGHKPEVHPHGWSGITVSASYIILDGFMVIGANDSLVLKDAIEDGKKQVADAQFNTNGIFVNGRTNLPSEKPHHVIVRNCTVAKCPGGGITAIEADYVTVEDCMVYDNCWFMRFGGSGITTLNNWAFDDLPGYHMVFQRNKVWNNKTLVPWSQIGKLSDGNGILLDVTDQSEGATNPNADTVISGAPKKPAADKPKRPEWKGRSLIANNLCVHNGGSGIHTFRTKHVDIINNTTYWNGGIVGYQELFPNRSEDVVIMNNIIVPKPGGKVTSNNKNIGIKWDYNIYSIEQKVFPGEHDIVADPKFLKPDIDVAEGNFKLAAASAALNSGTSELKQNVDISKKKRPGSKGIDRGCYEQ